MSADGMTRNERDAIRMFMMITMGEVFPDWYNTPISDMKRFEGAGGDGFEGTKYAGAEKYKKVYWMLKAMKIMKGPKNG